MPEITPLLPEALIGVWETSNRFVEFSSSSQMRVVLKTYYGFVYEPFPWINCQLIASSHNGEVQGVYTLQINYTHDKKHQRLKVAVLEDSLYLDFMVRYPEEKSESPPTGLDGTWIASGTGSSIRLYPHFDSDTFYVLVFDGNRYYKIRYWQTDARERDRRALFTGSDGREVSLPKFIRVQETLYTCITSTGTKLRNFEQGSYTVEEGSLRFVPEAIIYSGTEAAYRHPIPFHLEGNVLAFGKPYLVRSAAGTLDGEIAAHNRKRRPPRKPVFEFMKLDFRWEEIERIRGNSISR